MDLMLFNPVIGMLHNQATGKWHPILFVERPLPGPYTPDKPVRHKSHGHHTEGFATRAEALQHVTEDIVPKLESCRQAVGEDIPWDGTGIPASVAFFVETPEGLKVAF